MKKYFLFIFSFLFLASFVWGDIIISQYYEGASFDKWIEITNVGASSVDLSNYYLARWANTANPSGNASSADLLSGSLAVGESVLYQHASAVLPSYASGTAASSVNFNGDDPMAITTGGTDWSNRIDCIYSSGTWGSNTSFYRNSNITSGNTNQSVLDGTGEWTEVSNATVDGASSSATEYLGTHVYSALTNDQTSFVTFGYDPGGTNIPSTYDTSSEITHLLTIGIVDAGSGDELDTEVTNFRLTPHSSNTADWTDNIQGIILHDGENPIVTGTLNITDTFIDIPIVSGNLTVPDGLGYGLELYVYLNTSNIDDNEVLSFFIDADNHGFTADPSGSGFASNFGADINSSDFTITVTATTSGFVSYPTEVIINTDFTVTAGAVDENGNVDKDYVANDIELYLDSGNGTLSGTGVGQGTGQTLVNGIYTWSDVQYDTAEDFVLHGFIQNVSWNTTSGTITASEGGIAPIAGDLIITEICGDGVDGNASNDNGFMEIFNNSDHTISLDNLQVRYYNTNPGNPTQTVDLSGTINSGAYVIVAQNETNFNSTYAPITADFSGSNFYFNGGDDGVDLYDTTSEAEILDSFNDNGSSASPWTWNDDNVFERTSSNDGAVVTNWTENTMGTGTPGTDNENPLPVTLTDFSTAIIQNEFVEISWTTQSESSINSWNLYRSTQDNAEQIWLNTQAGTNSAQPAVYTFEDHEINENVTYLYYLEAIEYDGTSNMWGPISAMLEEEETPELPTTSILESNYPNPFNPSTTIYCEIKEGEIGQFTIYNSRGQVIERQTLNAGEHLFEWDGTQYGSGVYLYKLETESYVKTRKMMMIK